MDKTLQEGEFEWSTSQLTDLTQNAERRERRLDKSLDNASDAPAPGGQPTSTTTANAADAAAGTRERLRPRRVLPNTQSSALEHQRRNVTLAERLLNSHRVQRVAGLLVAVMLPALWAWGWGFWQRATGAQWASLVASSAAFLIALTAIQHLSRLPRTRADLLIIPGLALCYGLMLLVVAQLGITHDHRYFLISFGVAALCSSVAYRISTPYRRLKLAVVPFGKAPNLCDDLSDIHVSCSVLSVPSLGESRVDGVIADLRAPMPESWARFLADCTLHRIPVHHVTGAIELLAGRVHLYENRVGPLQPDEGYEVAKRVLDVLGVIVLLPIALPIMALTALAIRLESPGRVIFSQRRIGLHYRPFTVYKFRSMYTNFAGAGYTQDGNDPRITRVGRVIRKTRIDELPQLFNVLKGEMSLIGPRPESQDLTDGYQDDVPFFHFRHIVRPGISGWAQVEQGYAAEIDGMTRKLEYDFYYIKHFSLWLDLLIVIRTIKTVLTGFGAR